MVAEMKVDTRFAVRMPDGQFVLDHFALGAVTESFAGGEVTFWGFASSAQAWLRSHQQEWPAGGFGGAVVLPQEVVSVVMPFGPAVA